MELRKDFEEDHLSLRELAPPKIENFVFLGDPPPLLMADMNKKSERSSQMKLL